MKHLTKFGLIAGVAGAVIATMAVRRSKFSFRNQSVLITGGSRGLGLLIARLLAKEGARLTIVGRDQETLEIVQKELTSMGAAVRILPCDIRNRHEAEEAVQFAVREFGSIDVLINNAGIIQVGPLEHMRLQDFEDAIATHAWAPLHTMLASIPHMRQQGSGRIVNISSIGGKIAVPHLGPYSMSKFALAGLSDAMRTELHKYRIYVTSVYPGLMRTGSHVNARFKGKHHEEYMWFSLMAALPTFSISGQRAARQIVDVCRAGKPELIIATQAKLAVIASAIFPNLTARAMRIVNALLPQPLDTGDPQSHSGWASRSALSPSLLTRLADDAIQENNEYHPAA